MFILKISLLVNFAALTRGDLLCTFSALFKSVKFADLKSNILLRVAVFFSITLNILSIECLYKIICLVFHSTLFSIIPIVLELSVGMTTEGIDVRSVGNTMTLHETALVEAFNLKAAIEYQLKNCELLFDENYNDVECIFVHNPSVIYSHYKSLMQTYHIILLCRLLHVWQIDNCCFLHCR